MKELKEAVPGHGLQVSSRAEAVMDRHDVRSCPESPIPGLLWLPPLPPSSALSPSCGRLTSSHHRSDDEAVGLVQAAEQVAIHHVPSFGRQ